VQNFHLFQDRSSQWGHPSPPSLNLPLILGGEV